MWHLGFWGNGHRGSNNDTDMTYADFLTTKFCLFFPAHPYPMPGTIGGWDTSIDGSELTIDLTFTAPSAAWTMHTWLIIDEVLKVMSNGEIVSIA